MSRRAPPREFYEDIELERTRDPPRARRHGSIDDEIDFRRRRPIPPVEELDRLDIRERPRDFMRESFDLPRERAPVTRRSREGVDEIPQAGWGDMYMSPPQERRRYRPRDEEIVVRERERGGDRRRRSERDLVDEEVYFRERAPPRRYESDREDRRERFDDEQDEVYMRLFRPGRKSARREEIEEYVSGEREREHRARSRRSRDEPRFDRREEVDEVVIDEGERDRPRRSSGEREVEDELIVDERERTAARPPDRRSHGKPRREDEIIMKWKDRPSPGEIDEDEIIFRETRRRRRSSPDTGLPRELDSHSTDGDEAPDEEIRIRSRIRPRPRAADEEIVIRRGERDRRRRAEEVEEIALLHEQRERDRRRAVEDDEELVFRDKERDRRISLEDDEIMSRKSRRRSPPRERSPSLKSIYAPPIHQDIITHHRHIDHGYDVPPRAPTPEIPSTQTSFDVADVQHRSQSHKSEEHIVSKYRDEEESVSSTSGPPLDFNNPWEADRIPSRSKRKSLIDDEIKSISAKSSRSHAKKPLYREIDVEVEDGVQEKIVVEESRSTSRPRARSQADDLHDTADEWSVVHAPSKDEAIEMSGALNVIGIAPKGSMNEEVDRRAGSQVSKERHDERWTEITKDLVVREAIERLGYEFEETRSFYYIFSFMEPGDIDELVELSDEIRHARRRRIHEMQRERASIPPRPVSWADRAPPRPAMGTARRIREREWFINTRS